jgi:bifunctional non-homologous end joining protein LigD
LLILYSLSVFCEQVGKFGKAGLPRIEIGAFRRLAVFDLIRHKRHGDDAVLIAFDLIELDGEDLRRTPIEQRKRTLAKLVRRPHAGIALNEVFEGDGDILFAHACKLGCEGIVSKRVGSLYRSGRSPHWVKVKNPKAPAVKREAEEDWGTKRWSHGR